MVELVQVVETEGSDSEAGLLSPVLRLASAVCSCMLYAHADLL